MPSVVTALFAALVALAFTAGAAEPLTSLQHCSLVATVWADGDSFLVRDDAKREFTLRLYGVDCLETRPFDETDARRLRAQRRYFGISNTGGSSASSIEAAHQFGIQGKQKARELLQSPFTVHTSYSDARGDGRYQRVYGFVTLNDGRDLAAELVKAGLARAYGVYRRTPDGRSHEDYRQSLIDLELQAARRGIGIWAKTDWEALPDERRKQREEDAEIDLAVKPPALSDGVRLDPNSAPRDDLMKLPGIGETLANRIIQGRPYQSIDDLRSVPGIGASTLAKLKPFLSLSDP